jgi:polyhydroxybutyrate depolymerase
MKKILLLVFTVLSTIALKAQITVNDSMTHNGITRYYNYYVPASYNGVSAFPLVLNLHGYGSASWQQAFYGDFRPIADTANFIVVHPDGSFQPGSTTTQFWNVGFFPSAIDDIDFLERVIDSISARYYVNHTRVYSTGMSNGGFMSYELACQSDRFAAIASVTGSMTTQTVNNCNPSKPMPVMQIHGTADPTVPYAGNTGLLPVDSVVSYWVNYNNCPTPATFDSIPNTIITDNSNAEHYVWAPGDSSAAVEFYKVINGAHTWPGASYIIGVTCQDFKASKEIWRFFSQYGDELPLLLSVEENRFNSFNIWPNPATEQLRFRIDNFQDGIVNIYAIDGKSVATYTYNGNDLIIDLTALPSAVYIIEFTGEKGRMASKFVKQ